MQKNKENFVEYYIILFVYEFKSKPKHLDLMKNRNFN